MDTEQAIRTCWDTGFLSLAAARLGYRVTAVDVSEGMLGKLRASATEQGLDMGLRRRTDGAASSHQRYDARRTRLVESSGWGPARLERLRDLGWTRTRALPLIERICGVTPNFAITAD